MTTSTTNAAASGTLTLGGDLDVTRMGFGAMRITGQGIWGDPADRDNAHAVLRRAVELGVDLVDTADSYGPEVSEDLIREALHTGRAADPYGGVTIATKGGQVRTGPGGWEPLGRPAYLRQCVEMSLRRLQIEHIDLYQLHRIDTEFPLEDQVGELATMREEGKIGHLGLSEVTVDQIEQAQRIVPIVSVQNRYNLTNRASQDVLDHCTEHGIGFLPWHPVAVGELARPGGPVDDLTEATGATPAQLALAWLLATSPVVLPIPGTSSVAHLEENVAAVDVTLTAEQVARLDAVA